MLKQLSSALVLLAFSLSSPLLAQQANWPQNAPIKRAPLQKFDVPGTNYESVGRLGRGRAQHEHWTPHPFWHGVRLRA